ERCAARGRTRLPAERGVAVLDDPAEARNEVGGRALAVHRHEVDEREAARRVLPKVIAVAPPARRRFLALRVAEGQTQPEREGEPAELVLADARPGPERDAEVRQRDRHRVLPAVEPALGVEDLARGARGIAVERNDRAPRLPLAQLVDEAKAFEVG